MAGGAFLSIYLFIFFHVCSVCREEWKGINGGEVEGVSVLAKGIVSVGKIGGVRWTLGQM